MTEKKEDRTRDILPEIMALPLGYSIHYLSENTIKYEESIKKLSQLEMLIDKGKQCNALGRT